MVVASELALSAVYVTLVVEKESKRIHSFTIKLFAIHVKVTANSSEIHARLAKAKD